MGDYLTNRTTLLIVGGVAAIIAIAFFMVRAQESQDDDLEVAGERTPQALNEDVAADAENTLTQTPTSESDTEIVLHAMQGTIEELVTDLDTPWEIAFMPDGTLLVAERPGRVTHVALRGAKTTTVIAGAITTSESGVNGLALDPDFAATGHVFVYFRAQDGNRVVRYEYSNQKLINPVPLITGIPAARFHDGGRIAFGPDGMLYITTGDATNENDAQDTNSLAGKILRIGKDGSILPDNPFGNAVWSYGHRNPQGLAWDDTGRLWATEHGPSGAETGNDEVNLIEKDKNYGWPVIRGKETREGMVPPVIESTRQETWAPAGAAYFDGSLFFGGLRGETLYEATLSGTSITNLERHFVGEYGRIRAMQIGPDGMLYFSTSNRNEGGGVPDDDRIIRMNPNQIFR